MRRALYATGLACAVGVVFLLGQTVFAASSFSFDFVAAEPSSYDHATGGGAYNFRTINTDVVESLEGGDFACTDIVTFFTQIKVDAGLSGQQAVRLNFEWTAHSTGQQGVALVDNDTTPPAAAGTSAAINTTGEGAISDAAPPAVAAVSSEGTDGTNFVKPSQTQRSVIVTGLNPGDVVVLRTDVRIICNGQSPTGNMQGRLKSIDLLNSTGTAVVASSIPGGDQTIPFKHVGDIKPPMCDPKDPNCKP